MPYSAECMCMARKPAPKSKALSKGRRRNIAWKKDLLNKKRNKKLKNAVSKYLAVFVFFGTSLLFLSGYITYKRLTNPFASAQSTTSGDVRTQESFMLALYYVSDLDDEFIKTNKILLLYFDLNENRVIPFDVPLDREVDIYGALPIELLEKVYGLTSSVSSNVSEGTELLTLTLQREIKYPIDRYIVVEESFRSEFDNAVIEKNYGILLEPSFIDSLKKGMYTDMNASETYFVYKQLLASPGELSNVEGGLDDLSTLLTDYGLDTVLSRERANFTVLNASGYEGMAQNYSSIITNLGGRVRKIANYSETLRETTLFVPDNSSSVIPELLRYFKDIKVKEVSEADIESGTEFSGSEYVLVIGLDIADSM